MKYESTLLGQDDGYLNTAPLKDQRKTFHESRVDVALLITDVWSWSSHGAVLKS